MQAYQIKIEFVDSKPLIWRRVIMPADATFNRLNDVIQTVTNFRSGYPYNDYHLYEFNLPDENIRVTNSEEAYEEHKYYQNNKKEMQEKINSMPDEFDEFKEQQLKELEIEVKKPSYIKIDEYLKKYEELDYVYDFGDYWQIKIILEKEIDDYDKGYPTLIDGANNAPPEDVGGLPGFYDFLEKYNNPEHPEHEFNKSWANDQNYREYNEERINESLKSIKYK
jgi:hypothetical protein